MKERPTSERIEQWRRQIRSGTEPTISLAANGWLSQSLAEGEALSLALSRYLGERSVLLKSHPGQGLDLFHDLALRDVRSEHAVLKTYDRSGGWRELTRAGLLARSLRLARALRDLGVEPGASLLIALPAGEDLLVALLAGIRLGACMAVVQPRSRLLFLQRTRRAEPAFVYSRSMYLPLLRDTGIPLAKMRLDEPAPSSASDTAPPHTYAPEDPVLLLPAPLHGPLLDELHGDGAALIPVTASALWQGLLRDAVLCFALERGEVLAAPGVWTEQYQPGLLLTTLIAGATFVEIQPDELALDPRLLKQGPIHLLIASTWLLELLLTQPRGAMPQLHGILRDSLESADLGPWQQLRTAQGWERMPIGSIVYESAVGGCVLFSARTQRLSFPHVLPVPGAAYKLLSPDDAKQPSPQESGIYLPAGRKQGFIVLGRREDQFVLGGTKTPRRAGRLCPEAQIAEALDGLPFVEGAAVVPLLLSDGSMRTQWVLVIHTGTESPERLRDEYGKRQEAVREALRAQLGAGYMPDEIVLFALPARRLEGKVDRKHIRSQYLSGVSHRKNESPVLIALQAERETFRKWIGQVTGPTARGAKQD